MSGQALGFFFEMGNHWRALSKKIIGSTHRTTLDASENTLERTGGSGEPNREGFYTSQADGQRLREQWEGAKQAGPRSTFLTSEMWCAREREDGEAIYLPELN